MAEFVDEQYDFKSLLRYFILALVAIAFWRVTQGFGSIAVALLVLFAAMRGKPIELMFWTLFMTFSTAGNHELFTRNIVSVMAIRGTLVLLTAILATRLVGGGQESRLITPFLGILIYIGWECIVSAQGYSPIISYLKLFLFFCVFLAMYGVANVVNRSSRTNAKILRSAILAMIAFIVLGSIALIPFPALSQLRGDAMIEAIKSGERISLYIGMTAHSQVLGPMMGILATFLFADLVFSIKKWDKFYLIMLLCCLFLVYKSSSRTGMGTLMAGVGMAVFLVMRAQGLGSSWKGRVMMSINTFVVIGVIVAAVTPSVRERIAQFTLKSKDVETNQVSMEGVISSRQEKIDNALYNFKQKPILGNGFQVSDEMAHQHREGIAAYLTAAIEKGVWVYAILEEGGAIGMLLFAGWLVVLFYLLIQRHAYIGASVFFSLIVMNLGEFSMFSMSYVGGIYWTLAFAATCLDVQRMKSTDMPVFFVPIEQVMEEVGIDMWTKRLG